MGYISVVFMIMAYSVGSLFYQQQSLNKKHTLRACFISVRVQFEIGHEASIRTKKTPEGFTHDWEVFVRGADNTDIQNFVDKVVFHLHETFPKPRRVIKDPPYLVKESGYAGFVLPIDVYLKNKEEPKKISFQYDLTLQPSGPPISRVLREPRLFQNPSEDFRRKLIRGGGVGVDTPVEGQTEDVKSVGLTQSKPKLTESPIKKHKPDLTSNHSFAELFGTPIRRIQEPKKLADMTKKISDQDLGKEKKKIIKHGSFRDEKEIAKEKEKFLEKERSKDRDKSKERLPKRPPTPLSFPQPVKAKESNKKFEEKDKKKEEIDEKRKKKDDRDKKEKTKDGKDFEKILEKDQKKEKKVLKEGDHLKKMNFIKSPELKTNFEKHENIEKERPEKEKHKHRHKKKEKEKNRDREKHRKDRDKGEKDPRERYKDKERKRKKEAEEPRQKEEKLKKSKSPSPSQEKIRKGPLNALLDELGSSDSASPYSEEDPVPSFKQFSKPTPKIVPDNKSQQTATINSKVKSTNSDSLAEKEIDKVPRPDDAGFIKIKKEKQSSKKNKKSDKDAEKRKPKEESRAESVSTDGEDDEAEVDKTNKEEKEKDLPEEERPKLSKEKENRKRKKERSVERHLLKTKKSGAADTTVEGSLSGKAVELPDGAEESRKQDKFTKEYVAKLKHLQHRIMTLDDNAELQKVVRVIAETGQYEITNKTFDFDLCALDSETIKRLLEFFAPT